MKASRPKIEKKFKFGKGVRNQGVVGLAGVAGVAGVARVAGVANVA